MLAAVVGIGFPRKSVAQPAVEGTIRNTVNRIDPSFSVFALVRRGILPSLESIVLRGRDGPDESDGLDIRGIARIIRPNITKALTRASTR